MKIRITMLPSQKALGGDIETHGSDFTNGLMSIDEGGSHESNPLDGVPMGLDPEGIPNLVEEGETIYNDYVFSDRMMVPDFMYKELGLGGVIKKKGRKGMSFADASKKLAEESEQRPNDPISQDGLKASLTKLAEVQETERMRKQAEEYTGLESYAYGGKLGNKYDGTGNESQQLKYPTFDTPWSLGLIGTPDIYYDFAAKNSPRETSWERLMNNNFKTYYDVDKYYGPEEGIPYDNRSVATKTGTKEVAPGTKVTTRVTNKSSDNPYGKEVGIIAFDSDKAAEEVRKAMGKDKKQSAITEAQRQAIAMDGYNPETMKEGIDTITRDYSDQYGLEEYYKPYDTWMRMIPAWGSTAMALSDMFGLTNNPDYTYADKLEAAANSAAYAPNITYNPNGDYMRYDPLDRLFQQNNLNAIARAAERTIMNSSMSPTSKYAALLAANYNNQLAAGNLFRQEQEYNRAQYERVKDFNRRTNMFNSQMGLEADMANARYRQQAQQMGLSGLAQAAALRDSIDQRVGAARSANITNALTSWGNIGRENFALNQINSDRSRQYGVYKNGVSEYKRSSKDKKGSRWTSKG